MDQKMKKKRKESSSFKKPNDKVTPAVAFYKRSNSSMVNTTLSKPVPQAKTISSKPTAMMFTKQTIHSPQL